MTRSVVLFVLFSTLAPAATDWTYGSSDHFEVYTTGNAGKARDALNYFERIHAFFADVLKVDPQLAAPTRLIIFSNEKEYLPYRPNEGAFAFYQAGPDRDYIVMQSLNSDTYPVVIHEYMHLIVKHLNASRLPIWLNEGWADYYSTIDYKLGKMAVGSIPPGRLQHVQGIKLMPLESLFAVGPDSAEYNKKEPMANFYAQSWALTHMLLASEDYYTQSPKFLDLMLKGGDSVKAMTEAYGRPLTQIAKDLDAYLRIGQFKLILVDYKNPKARKDLQTREASPFEASLVTANLQAVTRAGEATARAAFAALEKENEAHLELQESIAYFEYRRGHRDAALPHFARAAALDSKNWQLYRDYAYLVTDQTQHADLLAKAVSLNSNDLDTRLRLADAMLRINRTAQALAALVMVKTVDKEHAFTYFQLAARANAANQRFDDAKKTAEKAVEFASTPVEKDYAARLLKSLDRPVATARTEQPRLPDDFDDGVLLDGARPTLMRRDSESGPVSDAEVQQIVAARMVNNSEVVVDAKFQTLDCEGETPVMQFTTAEGPLRLLMDSPGSILLRGAGAGTMNLNCGTQGNKEVRIGYNRGANAARRSTGSVRYLELK